MTSPLQQQHRMVADVGGTNTRIALYDPTTGKYRCLRTYINREHGQFEDIIARWLAALDEPAPTAACIAVAAPPRPDQVKMSNMDWSFSCRALAARFDFAVFNWINDFESNAYALPHLGENDRELLHSGANAIGKLATMGPGTGLGGATLEETGLIARVTACEPGHMGLSPASELELELFRLLLPRHGNIHAELLVSGPGLQRLYGALGEINSQITEALDPAEIAAHALAGTDALCVLALNTFCSLLGSVCGDFVLANGAYRGLYLAGGILPRMLPFLRSSDFLQRFCDKGAMGPHLKAVSVYAITTAQPGLIGAAHAPLTPS